MIRILLTLLLLYVALVALAFLFQRSLLYHPTRQRAGDDLLRHLGLRPWPNADEFRGYLGPSPRGTARGTAVVFHGNAGAAHDRTYFVDALAPLGLQVLLAEYPGYAGRAGPVSEASIVEDARETVRRVQAEASGPLYLWGESLGSAVVAALAADPQLGVDGIVLITPWDTLPALAQRHYWFLPVRWLMRDRFDCVGHLRGYRGPTAVLIAEEDTIVPPALGRRLYESLAGPKRLWTFEGAGHNTWPSQPSGAWWREVVETLEED